MENNNEQAPTEKELFTKYIKEINKGAIKTPTKEVLKSKLEKMSANKDFGENPSISKEATMKRDQIETQIKEPIQTANQALEESIKPSIKGRINSYLDRTLSKENTDIKKEANQTIDSILKDRGLKPTSPSKKIE